MNAFLDMLERTFWSFAATFGGTLLASPVFSNLGVGWQDALKLSVFVSGATALKVVVAYAANKESGGQLIPGAATVEVVEDSP